MSRAPDLLAKISLLRAAEEVFAEKGIALAKVEEITRRAGLSKGAFYLHFDSKEEAFKEVVESFLARCTTIFPAPDAIPHELPEDPEEMLAYTLDRDTHAFEFMWQNRHFLAIVEACNGPQGYLLDAFLEVIRRNTEQWCVVWQRRGLFRRDLDVDVAATLLVGAYRGLVRKLITHQGGRPPIRQWLSDAQTLFVRGLGADELIAAAKKPDRQDSIVVARSAKKARHGT